MGWLASTAKATSTQKRPGRTARTGVTELAWIISPVSPEPHHTGFTVIPPTHQTLSCLRAFVHAPHTFWTVFPNYLHDTKPDSSSRP